MGFCFSFWILLHVHGYKFPFYHSGFDKRRKKRLKVKMRKHEIIEVKELKENVNEANNEKGPLCVLIKVQGLYMEIVQTEHALT